MLLILSFEPEFSTNFDYFNIYEQLKFHAQLTSGLCSQRMKICTGKVKE